MSLQQTPPYRVYVAWDLPTRLFHWVNALAVIGLLATGIAILSDDALGFSAAGKVLLKSVHVSFGYVMALNLLWRFVRAFPATDMPDGAPCRPAVRGSSRLQRPMRRPSSLVSHSNMLGITRWRVSELLCSLYFLPILGRDRPCAGGHRFVLATFRKPVRGMDCGPRCRPLNHSTGRI